MSYAFFRISTASSATDQEVLNQFLKTHCVVQVDRQFHNAGPDGYWCFCIQWEERGEDTNKRPNSKIDYKTVLTDSQFGVFSKLRDKRKEIAEKDGVPVYAVATNEQLAEMVKMQSATKGSLLAIAGFGASKVDRYGNDFLQLLPLVGSTQTEERGLNASETKN